MSTITITTDSLIIGGACLLAVSFILGIYLGHRTVKPTIARDIREQKLTDYMWDKGVL